MVNTRSALNGETSARSAKIAVLPTMVILAFDKLISMPTSPRVFKQLPDGCVGADLNRLTSTLPSVMIIVITIVSNGVFYRTSKRMGVSVENKLKPELNNATLLALMEIMSIKEVTKLTTRSYSALKRLKRGLHDLERLPSQMDREFLKEKGLKICQCCETGIVPTKPVRWQLLTILCEKCWTSDLADLEEHHVTVDYGEFDI